MKQERMTPERALDNLIDKIEVELGQIMSEEEEVLLIALIELKNCRGERK